MQIMNSLPGYGFFMIFGQSLTSIVVRIDHPELDNLIFPTIGAFIALVGIVSHLTTQLLKD